MKRYTTQDMTGGNGYRVRYTFTEPNKKGEILIVDLSNGRHDLCFCKNYVQAGDMWRMDYNPQLDSTKRHLCPEWLLKDTAANRQKLIDEIERRFYA